MQKINTVFDCLQSWKLRGVLGDPQDRYPDIIYRLSHVCWDVPDPWPGCGFEEQAASRSGKYPFGIF